MSDPLLQGWKIEQQNDLLGTVIVTAPNGYVAITTEASRNPENVLRMLALAALAAPTGAAPAEAYAWRAAGAMREAARYRWLRDRSGYDIRTLLGVGDFTTLDDFIDRAAAQTPAAPTGDSHE